MSIPKSVSSTPVWVGYGWLKPAYSDYSIYILFTTVHYSSLFLLLHSCTLFFMCRDSGMSKIASNVVRTWAATAAVCRWDAAQFMKSLSIVYPFIQTLAMIYSMGIGYDIISWYNHIYILYIIYNPYIYPKLIRIPGVFGLRNTDHRAISSHRSVFGPTTRPSLRPHLVATMCSRGRIEYSPVSGGPGLKKCVVYPIMLVITLWLFDIAMENHHF